MSRDLHLLEVDLHWPPETFLQWKLKRLADRGIRVTVASRVPRRLAGARVPGVTLKRVPNSREPRALSLLGVLLDAIVLGIRDPRRLKRVVVAARSDGLRRLRPGGLGRLRQFLALARLRPDVVHFEWTTAAVHHLPLWDVWGCPVVMSSHGDVRMSAPAPEHRRWVAALPSAYARAGAVHFVCEAFRGEGVETGLDPAKAWLIPPAVDPDFFCPTDEGDRDGAPLRVVTVGRLSWVKGHEYALQAIRLLLDRGVRVRLDVVGDGVDRDRIVGTIADLELQDAARLRGRLSSEELRALLRHSDVLLQPSVSEGIPTTVLEAMACALPVVVTDCGGTREAVTDGLEGQVVGMRDPHAMAAALESLWRDPQARRRMGAAGRARVESGFGLDQQVDRFLALYRHVSAGEVPATPRRFHLLEAVLRWPPETFLRWKLEALAARGVRVTVASDVAPRGTKPRLRGLELQRVPNWREPAAVKLLGGGWDALRLLAAHPSRLWRLVKAVRGPLPGAAGPTPWRPAANMLRRYLRLARLDPDVVHFEWETAAAHYLPLMDVWDCPVVMSCRGREIHVYPHTPGNEAWVARLPAAFQRVAAVHCVSEAIRAGATGFGLDPDKARVIPPAVDTRFFHPPARRPDGSRLRIVSVGDLFWVKGHEYTLHALRLLLDRGVPAELELVGDVRPDLVPEVRDHERLQGTIADLDLEPHVRLPGRLEARDVRDRLQRADVLLHASLAEGVPNTALEAMACGLPVVVTDCGGTREAVSDGREGFVVAPRDTPAMAAALETLWRDPRRRARMGAAGRARVEADFALGAQVERLLAFYEHVMNGAVQ